MNEDFPQFCVVTLQRPGFSPEAAIRKNLVTSDEALAHARLAMSDINASMVREIQIHWVYPGEVRPLSRYNTDGTDAAIVYRAQRVGSGQVFEHLWQEDFYGLLGRYTLLPIDGEDSSVASSGKFAVVAVIDTEKKIAVSGAHGMHFMEKAQELDSFEEAWALSKIVHTIHPEVLIVTDTGKCHSFRRLAMAGS